MTAQEASDTEQHRDAGVQAPASVWLPFKTVFEKKVGRRQVHRQSVQVSNTIINCANTALSSAAACLHSYGIRSNAAAPCFLCLAWCCQPLVLLQLLPALHFAGATAHRAVRSMLCAYGGGGCCAGVMANDQWYHMRWYTASMEQTSVTQQRMNIDCAPPCTAGGGQKGGGAPEAARMGPDVPPHRAPAAVDAALAPLPLLPAGIQGGTWLQRVARGYIRHGADMTSHVFLNPLEAVFWCCPAQKPVPMWDPALEGSRSVSSWASGALASEKRCTDPCWGCGS